MSTIVLLLVPMAIAAALVTWIALSPAAPNREAERRLRPSPPAQRPPVASEPEGPPPIDADDLVPVESGLDDVTEVARHPALTVVAVSPSSPPARLVAAPPPATARVPAIPATRRVPPFLQDAAAFDERFPDDDACVDYLKAARFPEGFVCPQCAARDTRPSGSPTVLCCRNGHRTSLVAGTVMQRTTIPLLRWFQAARVLVAERPEASAIELRRLLDLDRHEVALTLISRLRARLAGSDGSGLRDDVEVGVVQIDLPNGDPCEIGVAIEMHADTGSPAGERRIPARVHLRRLDPASQAAVESFLVRGVEPGSRVYTFPGPMWDGVASLGFDHRPVLRPPLPGLSQIEEALRAFVADTHRGALTSLRLDSDLATFAWRYNRSGGGWLAFHWMLGLPANLPQSEAAAPAAQARLRAVVGGQSDGR